LSGETLKTSDDRGRSSVGFASSDPVCDPRSSCPQEQARLGHSIYRCKKFCRLAKDWKSAQAKKIGKAITINGEFLFHYDLHVVRNSICVAL